MRCIAKPNLAYGDEDRDNRRSCEAGKMLGKMKEAKY